MSNAHTQPVLYDIGLPARRCGQSVSAVESRCCAQAPLVDRAAGPLSALPPWSETTTFRVSSSRPHSSRLSRKDNREHGQSRRRRRLHERHAPAGPVVEVNSQLRRHPWDPLRPLGTTRSHRKNPVRHVDLPAREHSADVRWLDQSELHALIAATAGPHPELHRALYLTAAMTGLRRGELLALRWRDVDWAAGVIRVRRSYGRGEFGTPKSRRSSRAVPLADRVAAELERHFKRSRVPGRRRPRLLPPAARRASTTASKLAQALQGGASRRGRRPRASASTTSATRSAPTWPPPARRCALQEWMGHRDYRTTASTPTTPPARTSASWSSGLLRRHNIARRPAAHPRRIRLTRRTPATLGHAGRQRRPREGTRLPTRVDLEASIEASI